MTRVFPALSFAILLAVAVPVAQQTPVLRSGTHTVSVYASVVDGTGRLVTGLTRDDFVILDDGKPQELSVFTGDLQPITIVVMLDRSGSVAPQFAHVRDAAEQFITHLGEADRARIGSFSTTVRIDPVAFTNNRAELTRILREDLLDAGPTPLWNAAASAMTALAPESGRRVILMFTDGYDNPLTAGPHVSLEDVRNRARADEIMLYGVGLAIECEKTAAVSLPAALLASPGAPSFQAKGRPAGGRGGGIGRVPIQRGPAPRSPGRIGGGGLPRGPVPVPRVPPAGTPRRPPIIDQPRGGDPTGRWPTVLPASPCMATQPDPGLRDVALDTGGGYFQLHTTDALGETFARVADELHRQYLLGFTPVNLDGKVHTLEVRMRDPSLTVRARKTYVAVAK